VNDTVKASIADLTDFAALDPFFRIIEQRPGRSPFCAI